MIIALMMLQIILVVLRYPAGMIATSPWAVFLPVMLIAFLWLMAVVGFNHSIHIDAWPVGSNFFGNPLRDPNPPDLKRPRR